MRMNVTKSEQRYKVNETNDSSNGSKRLNVNKMQFNKAIYIYEELCQSRRFWL